MKFVVEIIKESEGRYRGRCPALPGCVAQGQTIEETRQNLRQAACSYISSLDATLPEQLMLLLPESFMDHNYYGPSQDEKQFAEDTIQTGKPDSKQKVSSVSHRSHGLQYLDFLPEVNELLW